MIETESSGNNREIIVLSVIESGKLFFTEDKSEKMWLAALSDYLEEEGQFADLYGMNLAIIPFE